MEPPGHPSQRALPIVRQWTQEASDKWDSAAVALEDFSRTFRHAALEGSSRLGNIPYRNGIPSMWRRWVEARECGQLLHGARMATTADLCALACVCRTTAVQGAVAMPLWPEVTKPSPDQPPLSSELFTHVRLLRPAPTGPNLTAKPRIGCSNRIARVYITLTGMHGDAHRSAAPREDCSSWHVSIEGKREAWAQRARDFQA